MEYCNKMIDKDGVAWIHQDGQREEMKGVTAATVAEGHDLYNQAVGRVNAHQRDLFMPSVPWWKGVSTYQVVIIMLTMLMRLDIMIL